MLTCRICGCLCDLADTVNRICDDCREDIRYKKEKRNEAEFFMNAEFRQIAIEDMASSGY